MESENAIGDWIIGLLTPVDGSRPNLLTLTAFANRFHLEKSELRKHGNYRSDVKCRYVNQSRERRHNGLCIAGVFCRHAFGLQTLNLLLTIIQPLGMRLAHC